MKTKLIWMGGLLAVALAMLSGPAVSQGDEGGGGMSPEQKKQMDDYMELMKPGEHHKRLGRMIGTWDTETSMLMDPKAPPVKGTGVAVMSWGVPGKVILQRYTGTIMGKAEHGIGLFGYDNYKKKHWSVWTSTFMSGILPSEGVTVDKTHKVQVLYGPMDEPLTGEHDKPVKYVTRFIDDDTVKFEVWDLGIGENGMAVVKITYKRRKADK